MYLTVPYIHEHANCYVADMTHHEHLDDTFEGVVMLYNYPATAGTIRALTAIAALEDQDFDPVVCDDFFGRTVQVLSTDAGDIVIHGTDYLGQPMTANMTCTVGTVSTTKAFKTIHRIVSTDVAGNLTLKYGAAVGLPFCARRIINEYDGTTSQTVGTFVAPVATDPATAATGDVRGTYAIATVANGVKDIVLKIMFDPDAVGGLYGVRQA